MGKVPQIKPSRANRPRNAFDLSQRHMFTASPGMLLPIMSLDLIPHDHVEINAKDFMRTMPMNSAAFMSMRGVYEFYFVPYSHLYHQFDQFITGMKDWRSSFLSESYVNQSKGVEYLPMLNLADLHKVMESDTSKDIFGFSRKNNACRLLDFLGYSRPFDVNGVKRNIKVPTNVSPLRICAYNKIYYDYYYHDIYEPHVTKSYNLDNVINSSLNVDKFYRDSLNLHYRNATKDMFTSVRPSPLFGYFNNTNNLQAFLPSDSYLLSGVDLTTSPNSVNLDMSQMSDVGLSVSSIRTAFALDKLLNITARAGKTYAEQIKAHFGYEVSEGRDGKCDYIGGFDSNLKVGDVTQVSGSESGDGSTAYAGYLGRTTGKAISEGEGRVVYDAKEHGILMCIYSIVPDVQYDSTRYDPFNLKLTRGDFFIPEFEDLGMQLSDTRHFTDTLNSVATHGWQLRYSEYKGALDINHGQFNAYGPLNYWTLSKFKDSNFFNLHDFTVKSLKISPNWCNNVFAVNYNGSELTDCVFGSCYFNIQKVSDMSENGMPRI